MVFSSWIATHELIIRRLKRKRWGHVLFHGGVPSAQRGALVDRFREDPGCRVFLSTDAGGVGLNLQHAASTIINMDLPWNPAVLEQRIGRVHRLGQAKFMESVEAVTRVSSAEAPAAPAPEALSGRRRTQPDSDVESDADASASRPSNTLAPAVEPQVAASDTTVASAGPSAAERPTGEPTAAKPATTPVPVQNLWAPLLQAGLQLAQILSAASNGGTATPPASNATPSWVERDARTGRQYLRLPLPDPGAVQALATALSRLMEAIAR